MNFRNSAGLLLRSVLVGVAVLALFQPAIVSARVGVTSATDGDPMGKPPGEAERVLRLGVDVQANEIITTNANDRAHLVFLDGTALTIGPNARVVIDKFVYDPTTKTGDLALSASKGVFRLVGGKISKTNTVTITTPSSTIGIRGGITIVNVNNNTYTFVFGYKMTVTNAGQTVTTSTPGTSVTTPPGGPPGPPTPVKPSAIAGDLNQIDGTIGSNPNTTTQPGGQQLQGSPDPSGNTNTNTAAGSTNTTSTAVIPSTNTTTTTGTTTTPYVNGAPSTVAALSTLNQLNASAVYNGTVTGNVNGNPNAISGSYQNIWSFGTRTGNTKVTFDSTTYTGTTALVGNGPNFATTAPLSGGARSMNINGTFFSSSTDPAKTQAGTFTATGPAYNATGTFTGKK